MWTNLEWMNKQTNNKMCLCMNVFFFEKKNLIYFLSFTFPSDIALIVTPDTGIRYQVLDTVYWIRISAHTSDYAEYQLNRSRMVFSALTPGERGVAEWWSFSSHSADLIKHLSRYNTHSMNIWPIRTRRQVDRAVGCQVRNLWGVVLGRRCSLCPVSWPHPLSNQWECSITLLKIKMLLNSLKQSFIYTECHL